MSIELEDMDQVEAMKPMAMVPIGWSDVTVEEAEETTSKNDHPQVALTFSDSQGRTIRDWLTFSPSKRPGEPSFAMKKAKALLIAAGVEAESGKSKFPTERLMGKRVGIFVDEQPDNRPEKQGQMQRKVQGFREPGQSTSDVPGDTASDDDIPF